MWTFVGVRDAQLKYNSNSLERTDKTRRFLAFGLLFRRFCQNRAGRGGRRRRSSNIMANSKRSHIFGSGYHFLFDNSDGKAENASPPRKLLVKISPHRPNMISSTFTQKILLGSCWPREEQVWGHILRSPCLSHMDPENSLMGVGWIIDAWGHPQVSTQMDLRTFGAGAERKGKSTERPSKNLP